MPPRPRPRLVASIITLSSISTASGLVGTRLLPPTSGVRLSGYFTGLPACSFLEGPRGAFGKNLGDAAAPGPLFPIGARPVSFGAAGRLGFARVAFGGSLGIARGMSGGRGTGSGDDPIELDPDGVSGSGKKVGTKKRKAEKDATEAAEGKKKAKVARKATGKGAEDGGEDLLYAEDEDGEIAPLSSEAAKRAMPRLVKLLQKELKVEAWMVEKAATLFRDGATLPFVARYRKDETGGLDEEQLRSLQAAMDRFDKLEVRKMTVSQSLEKSGSMTAELKALLEGAQTLAEVEDIYLPFKPKRKTRASEARAKGLQPLADMIRGKLSPPFTKNDFDSMGPAEAAKKMAGECEEIESAKDALAGARDIIAEETMENSDVRKEARSRLTRGLQVTCKEKKSGADAEAKYTNYHKFEKWWNSLRPYEVLAISRGSKAKILTHKLKVSDEAKQVFESWLDRRISKGIEQRPHNGAWAQEIKLAVHDGMERLLLPALEREWWKHSFDVAQESALQTFASNLRLKLLQPPIKGGSVAAIDPGYRSGCKFAVVSETGKVLTTDVLHIQSSSAQSSAAKQLTSHLKKHKCTTIGLGNGQASRETEAFLLQHILEVDKNYKYTIVDEAGASVYSASALASKELSEMDVSLRGAVSLARRMQDPLAELVKVDPKSIGVGLYQHDVDQKSLAHQLGGVVEIAVNTVDANNLHTAHTRLQHLATKSSSLTVAAVGVDANTASPSLLRYISGLSDKIAQNIVKYREESGPFKSRKDILKVAGLGKKTFEQAAGFMRVYDGSEPLDATNIHPESYASAQKLLDKYKGKLDGISQSDLKELCTELDLGMETLKDVIEALKGPASDPRDALLGIAPPVFTNSKGMIETSGSKETGRKVICASAKGLKIEQLEKDMWLRGIVRNVVEFGCFVDIGVQSSGLLHRSEMAPGGAPMEVGRVLPVRLKNIDLKHPSGKPKIALSTKEK